MSEPAATGLIDWQQRVINEQYQLDTKMNTLRNFLLLERKIYGIDPVDLGLLYDQLHAMRNYNDILQQRIKRFT
jgi:hypothetical protein